MTPAERRQWATLRIDSRGELALDAYYYGFEGTGVPAIDYILGAVARAGKMYHHTGQWNDFDEDPMSCVDVIQEMADAAAEQWRAMQTPEVDS